MHFGGHFEFWPKKVSRNFWEVHGSLFSLKWVYNAKSSEKKGPRRLVTKPTKMTLLHRIASLGST